MNKILIILSLVITFTTASCVANPLYYGGNKSRVSSQSQVQSQELVFIHAPKGDYSKSHDDTIINYTTWDGTNWTAKVKVKSGGLVLFTHAPNGNWSESHDDKIINYTTWDGTNWTANAQVNSDGLVQFTHAPNGNWSESHNDTVLNYKTWDGTNWSAKIKN
jgi:hypothetical protein